MCVDGKGGLEGLIPESFTMSSQQSVVLLGHAPVLHPPRPPDLRSTDPAHVQQYNAELGATALHPVQHILGTQALLGVLVHGRIHGHHVIHAGQLKPVTSKEEQSIHILAQQSCEVPHGLGRRGSGFTN